MNVINFIHVPQHKQKILVNAFLSIHLKRKTNYPDLHFKYFLLKNLYLRNFPYKYHLNRIKFFIGNFNKKSNKVSLRISKY